MDIADIYAIRRKNLEALVEGRRFGDSQKEFALRINRAPSLLNQWLKARRNIGDDTRDVIEGALSLPPGWMDHDHTATPSNAGVAPGAPAPQPPVSLTQALEVLGIELARDMPGDVREDVADALAKLAKRKGQQRDQQQVQSLLSVPAAAPRKQA